MNGYEKLWAVFWICLFGFGALARMDCVAFCTTEIVQEKAP